ncbi:type II secretion system minor pseudopilin GspH [Thiohalobacter sp. IOR34]|uniref:type II secretion system minor pseudopilin GspH n=1 Tax=Thiohalobacter sp. IOR34 TaxID=3057176 RepID=UPI0025B07B35|nr:type II secretion system minor pseudopilin GspH [Thiohalobacter sp. IOR34]WJW75227.1 type II secretion system minor pseudopilin GspH [Thiohalobacter sp. IOR34]
MPRTPSAAMRGFTLLELLVVVVIIAIILGFVTLGLGGDRRGDALADESRRFAALLELASEQAVLRGEEWGVRIEPQRYDFLRLTEQGWLAVADDPLWRVRPFAGGTRLDLELEGRELALAEAESEEDAPRPTLLLLSSGEISPFLATFSAAATEQRFRVSGNLLGELRWETLEAP